MDRSKNASFGDRLSAAAEAKKAQLERAARARAAAESPAAVEQRTAREAVRVARDGPCHGNPRGDALRARIVMCQVLATALSHCALASARNLRKVDREMRWRWRLKVLWTAACMLRKRWADRADLNRCILRSRRCTA